MTDQTRKYVLAPNVQAFHEWRQKQKLPSSGRLAPHYFARAEEVRGLTLRFEQIVFLPNWYEHREAKGILTNVDYAMIIHGDKLPHTFDFIRGMLTTAEDQKDTIERLAQKPALRGPVAVGAWYDESADFARKEAKPTMCDKGIMGQCIIAYGMRHTNHRYQSRKEQQ